MNLTRIASILFSILLFHCSAGDPAFSWDDKGHRVVGLIAEANLTAEARKNVRQILPDDTTLADAAIWPDHEGRNIADFNPLHYVSIPDDAAGYVQARDCPERNCMVEALKWFLASAGDKSAPLAMRLVALRYVAHLVGDMHQPLHAGRAADRGGTDIEVSYRGATTRLHYFWDRDLVEMEEGSVEELAQRLAAGLTEENRRQWRSGDPIDWTNESQALARSHAYRLGGAGEISDDYVEKARPVVRARLVQAGLRLAWLLDITLK